MILVAPLRLRLAPYALCFALAACEEVEAGGQEQDDSAVTAQDASQDAAEADAAARDAGRADAEDSSADAEDSSADAGSEETRIRIIHTANDLGKVALQLDGTDSFSSELAYGAASDYVLVEAGKHLVALQDAQGTELASATMTVKARQSLSVIAHRTVGTEAGLLQLLPVADPVGDASPSAWLRMVNVLSEVAINVDIDADDAAKPEFKAVKPDSASPSQGVPIRAGVKHAFSVMTKDALLAPYGLTVAEGGRYLALLASREGKVGVGPAGVLLVSDDGQSSWLDRQPELHVLNVYSGAPTDVYLGAPPDPLGVLEYFGGIEVISSSKYGDHHQVWLASSDPYMYIETLNSTPGSTRPVLDVSIPGTLVGAPFLANPNSRLLTLVWRGLRVPPDATAALWRSRAFGYTPVVPLLAAPAAGHAQYALLRTFGGSGPPAIRADLRLASQARGSKGVISYTADAKIAAGESTFAYTSNDLPYASRGAERSIEAGSYVLDLRNAPTPLAPGVRCAAADVTAESPSCSAQRRASFAIGIRAGQRLLLVVAGDETTKKYDLFALDINSPDWAMERIPNTLVSSPAAAP